MRNLKKILALVLALMMTLSLMVTANATSFTDDSSISDDYAEAVEVLAGIGIFQGDNNGQFLPDTTLNRKDAAVLVYRIISGDVDDEYLSNYAGYAAEQFSDVSASAWYEPYVAYAVNGGYIQGDGKGHFNPDADITGTEVLTILLRAVGYDQNGEFSENWPLTVATLAAELGISVPGITLTKAVSREVVAELIFQTITKAYTVKYTLSQGYQPIYTSTSVSGVNGKITLGSKVFGLSVNGTTFDDWGRPYYTWTATKPSSVAGTVATIKYDYTVAYTTAVTECDIAADSGANKDVTYAVTVNGQSAVNYKVEAKDTVQTLGAQGRLTEVYYNYDGNGSNVIVMIDTFLAQVTSVTDATYDTNGHLYTPATIVMTVYDGTTKSLTLTNGKVNYAYAKGDMILINAYTSSASVLGVSGTVLNASATKYAEIVGLAPSVVGAQTVIHYNDGKHTVNGTTYNDALELHLNEANSEITNHTWYFDSYGNIIGVADIATVYSYGVISSIYWQNSYGGENGYAVATITYMDGTSSTEIVASIGGTALSGVAGSTVTYGQTVSSTKQYNVTAYVGNHLYQIVTNANGTLALTDTLEKTTAITEGVVNNGGIKINANTQFLIRSGSAGSYTYTPVTGYNNISSYNSGVVHYVLPTTSSTYAQYVYIIADATDAVTSNLFVPTTSSYSWVLMDDGVTVNYYLVTGYLDGVYGTYKVDTLALVTTIISNVEKPLVVTITNGEMTAIQKTLSTDDDTFTWSNANPTNSAYDGLRVKYFVGADGDTYDGTSYYNTYYWDVENATVVTGTWDGDMSGKNVILVFSVDGKIATQAYIFDKGTTGTDTTVTNPTAAGLSLTYTESSGTYTFSSILTQGTTTVSSATVYIQKSTDGVNWETVQMGYVSGSATPSTAPTAWSYTGTLTFTNSGTYYVRAVANNGDGTLLAVSDILTIVP